MSNFKEPLLNLKITEFTITSCGCIKYPNISVQISAKVFYYVNLFYSIIIVFYVKLW